MAAGEGIETMLALRMILPAMPMVAALSANHLAAILFPPSLRRLYVARDRDRRRRRRAGDPDRAGAGGRDRGARDCRRRWATSMRTSAASALPIACFGGPARAARPGRRGPLHDLRERKPRSRTMRRAPDRIAVSCTGSRRSFPCRKRAAPTAFQRAIGRQTVRLGNGVRQLFSAAPKPTPSRGRDGDPGGGGALVIAKDKIAAAPAVLRLRYGRRRCARRCRPGPPAVKVIAHEGRDGRGANLFDKGAITMAIRP